LGDVGSAAVGGRFASREDACFTFAQARSGDMQHRFKDIELDEETRELRRQGRVVHAEPKVIDLIAYLVRHADRVVSKQELFGEIWKGTIVGDAALGRCVYLARRALGDPTLIRVRVSENWIANQCGNPVGARILGDCSLLDDARYSYDKQLGD
jgi:DNA-binding response OmpR family regulator